VTIPEVSSGTRQHDWTNSYDKYIVTEDTKPNPDGVSPLTPGTSTFGWGKSRVGSSVAHEYIPVKKTICGLRRRTAWIIIAVVAVALVAGLTGGLVVGLRVRNSSAPSNAESSNAGSNNPGPSSNTTTSSNTTSPLAPLDPKKRAVSVATSSDDTLQVFYQDLNTTSLLYRLVWGGKAGAEQKADLHISPNQGTAVAAVSLNSSNGQSVVAHVFYVSTDSSNITMIVQATLDCPVGGESCHTTFNGAVNSSSSNPIHPQSGVSAALLDAQTSRFRLYYQAIGTYIWVTVGDNPTVNGWAAHRIGGPAVPGSSITSSLNINSSSLMAFYVANESIALRDVEYVDSIGAKGCKHYPVFHLIIVPSADYLQSVLMSTVHRVQASQQHPGWRRVIRHP
jgi:hypothetical protein